jgi:large subunit ribosomal protein L17
MRHRKTTKKLSRTASHRDAVFSNIATSLFQHKQIRTTAVKAKAARSIIERMITFAKKGSVADRRQVLRTIRDKKVVKNLFDDIAPVYAGRNGGYTRVIKLGKRRGDGAEMALLELVGYEGALLDKQRSREEDKAEKKAKKKAEEKAEEKQEQSAQKTAEEV